MIVSVMHAVPHIEPRRARLAAAWAKHAVPHIEPRTHAPALCIALLSQSLGRSNSIAVSA